MRSVIALSALRRETASHVEFTAWETAPGLEVAIASVRRGSAARPSGDFWDITGTVDGRWAITVGDMAGLGTAAATESERLASFVRALVRAGYHGADVVRHLDAPATALRLISSMVHVLVDPVASRVEVWRAGHPPPLVVSAGCASFLDGAAAPPLGAAAGHIARSTWALERECTIVLYTDGVIERRGQTAEEGMDALREAAAAKAATADEAGEDLCRTLLLAAPGEPEDDATILVVHLGGGAVRST